MASNTAAWITSAKAKPLEVKPAPLGVPEENQILVQNHALAINPIDGKLQTLAMFPLDYPTILGEDIAGVVAEVGPGVTRFKKGDRVLGVTAGWATKRKEAQAFQAYSILETNLTSEIPENTTFEAAVVLPLALATASAGLFNDENLNLQLPTEPKQEPTGKTILVWGGASSVGSCAIQLGVAAGYEVITTASPKNFEYVKKLGASQVFDYNSPTVVADLVEATKEKSIAGTFDAIAGPAWAPTVEFMQKSKGSKRVATVTPEFPEPPEGITMKFVQSLSIRGNQVGKAVFEDFVPKALVSGRLVPAPEPLVAGKGLESVQTALDLHSEGISARKVVVLL